MRQRLIQDRAAPPPPLPGLFSNLEHLQLEAPVPPAWLGRLPRLARLEKADLGVGHPALLMAGAALAEVGPIEVAFPPVPSLRALWLRAGQGVAALRVSWARLPALRSLALSQDELSPGAKQADLAPGCMAPCLESLLLNLAHVNADFGLFPALRTLMVGAEQLEGAASVACAPALERELRQPLRSRAPALCAAVAAGAGGRGLLDSRGGGHRAQHDSGAT